MMITQVRIVTADTIEKCQNNINQALLELSIHTILEIKQLQYDYIHFVIMIIYEIAEDVNTTKDIKKVLTN